MLAVLAAATLWTLGWPQRTPEGLVQHHRDGLAGLATDYRAGPPGATALSWRLRFLSIDGHAHHRCRTTNGPARQRGCALYLPAWQNWRGESGVGLAYYPYPPVPGTTIVTVDGDVGSPVRELGDSWWWVE